jgi:hypothetical protein
MIKEAQPWIETKYFVECPNCEFLYTLEQRVDESFVLNCDQCEKSFTVLRLI